MTTAPVIESLARRYELARTTPSDINEHLPTFVSLCEELSAQRVIELGTRSGVSSVGWLHGLAQTGGRLWSVDLDPAPDLPFEHWTFLQGNDLDPKIVNKLPDSADVVFVDTSHSYEQTLAELLVYRYKVRPGGVMVLHDTELRQPFGLKRQPDFPVKVAIGEFCREEGLSWKNHINNNGLGIIAIPE